MIVVGLTGSIGMGKTTVAALCTRLGLPVNSADDVVHDLLAPGGGAFGAVLAEFPQCIHGSTIDRRLLGAIVFADPEKLAALEAILHPLVSRARRKFLAASRRRRARIAVLDIPLLFERDLADGLDAIITVSAPSFVQRARVMTRPGMTRQKYAQIVARQMPDAEKRRRSDFVLHTGGSKAATLKQLRTILKKIDSHHARNRPRYRNHRP